LERDTENRKRVTYSTSKRFLSLFGLGSLDELPQADELAFK
jgi:segregation and condensation protein B